jgi:hypothetical protein
VGKISCRKQLGRWRPSPKKIKHSSSAQLRREKREARCDRPLGRTCSGDSAETKIYRSKNQPGRSTKLKIHERFHQQQKPGSKI